jgi:hypothetical protein
MVGEIESGGMDAEVRASVSWRRIPTGVDLSGVLNWMYVGWDDSKEIVDWEECWRAHLPADVGVVVGLSVVIRR